ncbi:phage tail sheath subtilisin-like domain-containing protein [Amorphus sp. 3PC139-8]|uniref:phage tail sheath subtilisin-like domain-containing protein n=1 Tax=Amorphus sp. 3PC139-8 TaxID=2735676 RepID=UPI00345CF654
MPISFNSIPAGWRVPLFYAEIDPSQAGRGTIDQPALLFGVMLSAGTATADVPIPISSTAAAKAAFGAGSMLTRMVKTFLANNVSSELICLPQTEPSGGQKASGTLEFSGPASAAGTLSLYIAGQRLQIAVADEDTATEVGDAVEAAVTAAADLPVAASNTDGTVTLTAKWKGETGNDIHVGVNLGGDLAGEALPAGIGVTITAMTGGTSAPDLANSIAALGDEPYEHVAFPYTDTTSLNAIDAEFGFGDAGRWGWLRQLYGHVWSAKRGTQGELTTFGNARNDAAISVLGYPAARPSPPWEIAAAYAAQAAKGYGNDPARPLQTLPLLGIMAEPRENRFSGTERNTLLYDGIATSKVMSDGTVQIERAISTYQKNAYDQADTAYLDTTTLATLAYVLRDLRSAVTSKYPRHKLADDGTKFGAGQKIVTPSVAAGEIVARYAELELQGQVENMRSFKANLVVERSVTEPNRLDALYPPDLVNQLRLFATLAQFRLQYANDVGA